MDRSDLERAMADVSQPSRPVGRSSPISMGELSERIQIFARLFTLYPLSATQDTEGAILAFTEETQDIPIDALGRGLRVLARENGRRFAPSVGEIRAAAAPRPKPVPAFRFEDHMRPGDRERHRQWLAKLEQNRRKLVGKP